MLIRFFIFVLFLLIQFAGFAQDIIVLKNKETIYCTLLEVMNDSIKYSINTSNFLIIEKIAKDQIAVIHLNGKPKENTHAFVPDSLRQANKVAMLPEFNEQRNGGPVNALYSLLLPGLGDYKTRQTKAPYWIIGLASYGLIGGGYYYKKESEALYNNYTASSETDHSTYNKANDFHHRYLVMTGLGTAIWLGDVLLVLNKGYKNVRNKEAMNLSYRLVHPEISVSSFNMIGLKWNL